MEPLPRTSNNPTTPSMNHDPSRDIDVSFFPRTEENNAPFVELGVEESFRDENCLAAFLACWLCKLALLNKKVNCIHASVFNVSSLMANGIIFSLVLWS